MKAFTVLFAIACGGLATHAQQAIPTPGAEMHHDHGPAQPSTMLTVSYQGKTAKLTMADLQGMPQTTVNVRNEHTKTDQSYAGPLVADVLAEAGFLLSESTQHSVLDSYVTASGTDGYFVVFSAAELQPGLHKAQAIVAITQSGQPLTRTGAFQLIDPLDVKPARWVRNLSRIAISTVAVPVR